MAVDAFSYKTLPPSMPSLIHPHSNPNSSLEEEEKNTKMKLNVFFFFLLAFSINAIIPVLSHIHSHVPSIAIPPDFASSSAPAPSPAAASADEFYFDAAESALSAMDTTELIQICDTTGEPELCKSTISSHISESRTVDPTSALKTEIEESIKMVEGGVAKLKALRGESAASKVEMACYDTCLENFDLAIFDLKSGLESIDAKDTGTMESVLAAVETNLVTCDDTFVEMGVESPLENLSTKMKKYAANCLDISKLLM